MGTVDYHWVLSGPEDEWHMCYDCFDYKSIDRISDLLINKQAKCDLVFDTGEKYLIERIFPEEG